VREMNPNAMKELSHVFTCYALRLLVLILENSSVSRQRLAAAYSWFGSFVLLLY